MLWTTCCAANLSHNYARLRRAVSHISYYIKERKGFIRAEQGSMVKGQFGATKWPVLADHFAEFV
jgi:hypothetical protein